MAAWNDLPNELHELILRFVCISIISEYTSIDLEEYQHQLFNPSSLFTPKILSHFTRTIRTCRYFHTAITDIIKFEEDSTATILMKLQFQHVDNSPLVKPLPWIRRTFNAPDRPLDRKGLEVIGRLVGPFWNNSLVLKHLPLTRFLPQIDVDDCFPILFKLFENWARGYKDQGRLPLITFSIYGMRSAHLDPSEHPPYEGDRLVFPIQLHTGKREYVGFVIGSTNRYDEHEWQVSSIEAVLAADNWNVGGRRNPEVLPVLCKEDIRRSSGKIAVFRDIILSPPNTWRLLFHDSVENQHYPYPMWYVWDSIDTKRFYTAFSLNQPHSLDVGKQVSISKDRYGCSDEDIGIGAADQLESTEIAVDEEGGICCTVNWEIVSEWELLIE